MTNIKLGRIFVQVIFGFLVLELLLRTIYFQKKSPDLLAIQSAFKSLSFQATDRSNEKLLENHQLVRPYMKAENEQIVKEVVESNTFEYTPWTDYKNIDYAGTYINTTGFERKTIPSAFHGDSTLPALKIFFFGGSTTYGFNVTDEETLPSAFTRAYAKSGAKQQSIQVANHGISAYHSYSELMLLTHLVYTGAKPDVVIFFDGLNDIHLTRAAARRVPWFYYRLKQGTATNQREVIDSTQSLFEPVPGEPVAVTSANLVSNYLHNVSQVRTFCKAYGIKPFFFIQPVPYYNYPKRINDPVCEKEESELFTSAYPLLEKAAESAEDIYFLGNMLTTAKGLPFIDRFHYSPEMNNTIAQALLDSIGSRLHIP